MEGPAAPSAPSLGASCCRSRDCTRHHPILRVCTFSRSTPGPTGPPPQRAGAAGASLQLSGCSPLATLGWTLSRRSWPCCPRPLVPPEGDRPIPTSTGRASFLNPHHSREAGAVLSGGGNCPGPMRPQATRAWRCQRQPAGSDRLGITGIPKPLSPEDPAAISSSVLTFSSHCCQDRPTLRLRHLHPSLLWAPPRHHLPVQPEARGGLVQPPHGHLAEPAVQTFGTRPHQVLAEHPAWSRQRMGAGAELVSLFTKHRDPAVAFAKAGWWMDGRKEGGMEGGGREGKGGPLA